MSHKRYASVTQALRIRHTSVTHPEPSGASSVKAVTFLTTSQEAVVRRAPIFPSCPSCSSAAPWTTPPGPSAPFAPLAPPPNRLGCPWTPASPAPLSSLQAFARESAAPIGPPIRPPLGPPLFSRAVMRCGRDAPPRPVVTLPRPRGAIRRNSKN
eukprot:62277-Prorocentrum_minimum.AAC.1